MTDNMKIKLHKRLHLFCPTSATLCEANHSMPCDVFYVYVSYVRRVFGVQICPNKVNLNCRFWKVEVLTCLIMLNLFRQY